MSGLKKYISKKLSYLQEHPEGGQDRRSRLDFLDPEEAGRLLRLFGRTHIGLVTLEIKDFFLLAHGGAQGVGPLLLDDVEFQAAGIVPDLFHHAKLLFQVRTDCNCAVLFFKITDDYSSFTNAIMLLRLQLNQFLGAGTKAHSLGEIDILVGHSHIEAWRKESFEDTLYRAYCQARRMALLPRDCIGLPLHDEFQWLLRHDRIVMLYQAVINFGDGSVMGWEGFMRGPESSVFHLPETMFTYAEETGVSLQLDRHCRRLALRNLGSFRSDQHLFINVHPSNLGDPNFTAEAAAREVRARGLEPGNVILEFTERHGIQDMHYLVKTLDSFRGAGFHIAVDDVGAGTSSLRLLSQLRPDYIKIDVSVVENIDADPFRRVMVETLAHLAERIQARLVAVGIETETEFSSLVSMGIFGGQGNYLTPPALEKSDRPVEIPVKATFSKENLQTWKCSLPIRELAAPSIVALPHTPVKDVKDMLVDKPPQTSVVVVRNDMPVGLLMQYSMDRFLSTKFGMSLYFSREIARIMDTAPLVVDEALPIEEVARKAMERQNTKIYDDIVVTSRNKLLGVVSVQRMLDTLAQTQVELAKGANPLSGLPGNLSIEMEIEARALSRTPSSLIYVDLDNFKVYNDVFGFERGDRIILLAAQTLSDAARLNGGGDDFVGHVGGDDFVILAAPEHAEAICNATMREFAMHTPSLYRRDDLERGYIVGKGRDGKTARYPLVSLSIAIIDCDFAPPFNMERLSQHVAEVKKAAKEISGNSCVRESYQAQEHETRAENNAPAC